jgi:uncharacterized protein (DUF362 family)
MRTTRPSRRSFLSWTAGAITAALASSCGKEETNLFPSGTGGGPSAGTGGSALGGGQPGTEAGPEDAAADAPGSSPPTDRSVAIVRCTSHDTQAQSDALSQAFDLLGGLGPLVQGRTVTIKPNLTGTPGTYLDAGPTDWPSGMLGYPAGETYITHGATVLALASLLLKAGATKVRIVESPLTAMDFIDVLGYAGFDTTALLALGHVEIEATRNMGNSMQYSQLNVPGGGLIYSSFQVNHSYADTDVFISLAKMKDHDITGVTLSMKNLFGILPLGVYGYDAARKGEDAIQYRGVMHDRSLNPSLPLPGEKPGFETQSSGFRMPRIITDLVAARPIHLAIVEAITVMRGGEGPWGTPARFTTPGFFIVGRNPVSTDAVSVAAMGYADPLADAGTAPFAGVCDNHILLAHQAGLGMGDLKQIDVRGMTLQQALQYDAG